MIAALAVVFLTTVLSGPAWDDWRARRRERRDRPLARVVYLPSARCSAGLAPHLRCSTCADELEHCARRT